MWNTEDIFWKAVRSTYQEAWGDAIEEMKAENKKAYDNFLARDPARESEGDQISTLVQLGLQTLIHQEKMAKQWLLILRQLQRKLLEMRELRGQVLMEYTIKHQILERAARVLLQHS